VDSGQGAAPAHVSPAGDDAERAARAPHRPFMPLSVQLVIEIALIVPTYLYTLLGPGGIVQQHQGWGAALLWTGVMAALAILPLIYRQSIAVQSRQLSFIAAELVLTAWAVWLAKLADVSSFLFYPVLAFAIIIDRRLGRAVGLAIVGIAYAEAYYLVGRRDPSVYVDLLAWVAGLLFTATTVMLSLREREARARSDQLLAELQVAHAQLRAYADQVRELATVQERNRLAQDLHDSVTQTLFSASLIADALPRLWTRQPEAVQQRLDDLRQLTRGALAEMRMLLLELRPSALTQVPFGDLLKQLATAARGRAQLAVEVSIEGDRALPPQVQVALYRIAQEALNNAMKYADAEHAWIRARLDPREVDVCVRDDGQGFDPAAVPAGHLGLGIMRERAQAIGAALRIESAQGNGTTITVTWGDAA
jgi:signal transduction histidine kinase